VELTGLVRGCHPAPTAAVTVVAGLLSVSAGGSTATTVLAMVTVLSGQLSIGWSNDWLDAARDVRRPDKPTATGSATPADLRAASLVALTATVALSLLAVWPQGVWQLVLVASGWVYNVRLKASPLSPLPYAVGFGALPVFVLLLAGAEVHWWLPTCGALLGVAAHFANAAPDVEGDLAAGVRGLPQRLGAPISLVIALVLLTCCGVVLLANLDLATSQAAMAWVVVLAPPLAAGWLLLRRGAFAVTFRLVMVAAVLDVGLLVLAA
jgi:4-hydroxybenzoate polyprenyltransferase